MLFPRVFLTALAALMFSATPGAAQDHDPVSDAVAALQRGDLASAEKTLHEELRRNPADGAAQQVLAIVLDREKKYSEAEAAYRRALAADPHSPALLNNYGNHLLATGKTAEARKIFLQVVGLDPHQANALVQLAAISLRLKSPGEGLRYLERLPPQVQESPEVADMMGVALSATGQYAKAETFFERAVNAQPDNFQALYKLGLAASRAGHKQRARDVLQKALDIQPANVDVQYDLAAVDAELNHKDVALELLARAARQAPDRADIQRLIAHISSDLGYFDDAVNAWNRYMILAPNDDTGRRERGFAEAALAQQDNAGIADLKWFVEKHPNDAVGHYELGTAEAAHNPDIALHELNRALTLKPDLAAARFTRGLLYYRTGKPQLALVDFEFAARREPKNPAILNRLGETYMALNRPRDAVEVLRKAAGAAPRDTTILLHFGRALSKTGQADEARAIFARVRELGPGTSELPRPAGLIDFLSLSPAEQQARYRAGVERTVKASPNNIEAQIRYLEILLEDRNVDQAGATVRKIISLNPSPAARSEAAQILQKAGQDTLAKSLLNPNAAPPAR